MNDSLLFIPDISGFTKFVNDTEVSHGQHVIAELLELIIDSDELGLTVSEVEGDAVLFYRTGEPPPLEAILRQAQITFEAFHAHLKRFEEHRICACGACRTTHSLSLKVVAHVGSVEMLSVKGFHKPYGTDVILAHRLLKNDIPETEYLLVTEAIVGPAGAGNPPAAVDGWPDWVTFAEGSADYPELGRVDFRYVPLGPLRARVPEAPPPPTHEKVANPIVATCSIETPPEKLYELISALDLRLRWNHGVDDLRYEPDRVNRVGTRHHCVIRGDLIAFETVTNDFGEGRIVYGERLLDNPLVDDVASYYVIEPEGSGSRLRMEVHYVPRPFPRNLLAPLFRFAFGRRIPRVLRAIREAAESVPATSLTA